VHLGSSQAQSINQSISQSHDGTVKHIVTSQVRTPNSSLVICGKKIVGEKYF